MRVGDIYIDALGTWLPEPYSAERAVREGLYEAVDFEENGLLAARVAGPDEAPAEMAVRAVRQLAERRGSDLSDVDLLVHAGSSWQGPEGWRPASYIQRKTVGGTGPAWELTMGCLGGLTALEVAVGFLRGDGSRRTVLFTSADNWSSPVVDRWRSFPGVILGDGASALTLGRGTGFARLLSVNTGGVPDLEGMYRGSEPLFPGTSLQRAPLDFRLRATAYKETEQASSEAMMLSAKVQLELIDRSLEEAGIGRSDITRVAYVNYARLATQMWLLDPLGIPMSTSTWEIGRHIGHIGPSDQLVSLDRLLSHGELGPGDHVLLAGLGPGMTLGSAVLEIVSRPSWLD
ncbi:MULTISPECIES: ketoacyl-ACP synthase III family protein [unclassified Streptomyces]|uniref:ketoacyl-ACP synthase III family protein n=1 Tax=unclassified Streptomyces TaxID=2593676 RepID=UPI002E80226B|nr:ketoacyl-ACP synthase III family protein [Streptomyces sp. NBC_00589]WTI41409.1 ketoacyl-ACP synthase III family protein [Streptomyces sp. NBC_00775]WUB24907.1 ketoacyl-ACP synthase III family protein [Streptomyces sp. NBC_00589]